ncbi:uncharacterized protein LOC129595345 [Paramacrobiotus metropolitanus]|uniref:uncharacterized protein LOC129595345 n=1 Tax=Paramacrobiotus metropolitanus TaxID=2943436 RepID=UPI0024464952|nr:uncharacterized protein LOC129595345 [Paramacrobiotus metropolitanus]
MTLLRNRYRSRSASPQSVTAGQLPEALFEIDQKMYDHEVQTYFSTPLTVNRKADGTVRVWIESEERSVSGESQVPGSNKKRAKRSRARTSGRKRLSNASRSGDSTPEKEETDGE